MAWNGSTVMTSISSRPRRHRAIFRWTFLTSEVTVSRAATSRSVRLSSRSEPHCRRRPAQPAAFPPLRAGRAEAGAASQLAIRTMAQGRQRPWRDELRSALDQRYQALRESMAGQNGDSPRTFPRPRRANGPLGLAVVGGLWARSTRSFRRTGMGRSARFSRGWPRWRLQKLHARCSQDPVAIFDIPPILRLTSWSAAFVQTLPGDSGRDRQSGQMPDIQAQVRVDDRRDSRQRKVFKPGSRG